MFISHLRFATTSISNRSLTVKSIHTGRRERCKKSLGFERLVALPQWNKLHHI